MNILFGALIVLITSTVVACRSTPEQTGYFITTTPIIPIGNGLCVGVDPRDPHGVWWWGYYEDPAQKNPRPSVRLIAIQNGTGAAEL